MVSRGKEGDQRVMVGFSIAWLRFLCAAVVGRPWRGHEWSCYGCQRVDLWESYVRVTAAVVRGKVGDGFGLWDGG